MSNENPERTPQETERTIDDVRDLIRKVTENQPETTEATMVAQAQETETDIEERRDGRAQSIRAHFGLDQDPKSNTQNDIKSAIAFLKNKLIIGYHADAREKNKEQFLSDFNESPAIREAIYEGIERFVTKVEAGTESREEFNEFIQALKDVLGGSIGEQE